jgi:hypothetical protein
MLVATAAVATGVGLWIAKPSWQIGLMETIVALSLPALLLTAAVSADARFRPTLSILLVAMLSLSLAHVNQIVRAYPRTGKQAGRLHHNAGSRPGSKQFEGDVCK